MTGLKKYFKDTSLAGCSALITQEEYGESLLQIQSERHHSFLVVSYLSSALILLIVERRRAIVCAIEVRAIIMDGGGDDFERGGGHDGRGTPRWQRILAETYHCPLCGITFDVKGKNQSDIQYHQMTCQDESCTGKSDLDVLITYVRKFGTSYLGADISDCWPLIKSARPGAVKDDMFVMIRDMERKGILKNVGYDEYPRYRFINHDGDDGIYKSLFPISVRLLHQDTVGMEMSPERTGDGRHCVSSPMHVEDQRHRQTKDALCDMQGGNREPIYLSHSRSLGNCCEAPRGLSALLVAAAPESSNGLDSIFGRVRCPSCSCDTSMQATVFKREDESPPMNYSNAVDWKEDSRRTPRGSGSQFPKYEELSRVHRTGKLGADFRQKCELCGEPYFVSIRTRTTPYDRLSSADKDLNEKVSLEREYELSLTSPAGTEYQNALAVRQGELGYEGDVMILREQQIVCLEKRQRNLEELSLYDKRTVNQVDQQYMRLVAADNSPIGHRHEYFWCSLVGDLLHSGAYVSESVRENHRVLSRKIHMAVARNSNNWK